MDFSEKLAVLRKEKGLSQEALAEMLNISRQAVSRWESALSFPETEKIIALSEIFGVTVDSLLKKGEINYDRNNDYYEPFWLSRGRFYEYKSRKLLFGLPLVHVNIGWGIKRAKGIIAIGNSATGIIAIGLLSKGILSLGLLSIGIIGLGVLSIGLLLALGSVSIGTISIGAVSLGIFSLGAVSVGKYAVGAVAAATDIAIGDHAYGHIAVGRIAEGKRAFADPLRRGGSFSFNINKEEVRRAILEEFPHIKEWIVRYMTGFIH